MFVSTALLATTLFSPTIAASTKLELKDGDRIVWIGNTLVEREQRFGYWESALHAAFPDRRWTFRNLGWSGDTVFGDARAGFDSPARGYERLVSLTLELKPTVILVSYGANESFAGEAGLPRFEQGLNKLLDSLKPAHARIVLFSPAPTYAREIQPGNPDPKQRNAMIAMYSRAIERIAQQRGLAFADLEKAIQSVYDHQSTNEKPGTQPALTENGIHLTAAGYRATASAFLGSLGLSMGSAPQSWDALQPLRNAIVEKNQLFFYRWRPQNETYLFGFRKHEQGKNAREVAEFDPLVGTVEGKIEKLRATLK